MMYSIEPAITNAPRREFSVKAAVVRAIYVLQHFGPLGAFTL